jgi:hypothetical protein
MCVFDGRCSMEQFSGAALLDALRCRTLLLYGDASLGEHWQALVCGAHGAAGAQYAVRWDDPGGGRCPHGEQHCAVQAGRASPPPARPPVRYAARAARCARTPGVDWF